MFNIGSRIAEINGNFSKAVAQIFSSLRSGSAKQITADLIGIFSDIFLGISELLANIAADLFDVLTFPFIENADLIKSALEETFSAVEPVFNDLKALSEELFSGLNSTYYMYVAPMFAVFKQGFTEIGALLLNVYNAYFVPVLENLSAKFSEFKDQYLAPLIDKFLEFGGKVAEAVSELWTGVFQPFIEWFIANMAPVIGENLQMITDAFFLFLESVTPIIDAILLMLQGVIDFLVGVFTMDWSLAWEGIKEILSGAWELMKSLVNAALTVIKTTVTTSWNLIKNATSTVWNTIKALLSTIWEWLRGG